MKRLKIQFRILASSVALLALALTTSLHAQETPAPTPGAEAPKTETPAPAPAVKTKPVSMGAIAKSLSTGDANAVAKFEDGLSFTPQQKTDLKKALDTYRDARDAAKNDNALAAADKKRAEADAFKALTTSVDGIMTDTQKEQYKELQKKRAEENAEAKKAAQEAKAKKEQEAKDAKDKEKDKKDDEKKKKKK